MLGTNRFSLMLLGFGFMVVFKPNLLDNISKKFTRNNSPKPNSPNSPLAGWWSDISYFEPHEFDSRDINRNVIAGSGAANMKQDFVKRLDDARHHAMIPFRISSGYRQPDYNELIGGVENSAHTFGCAADISFDSFDDAKDAFQGLLLAGFRRLGFYRTKRSQTAYFIHVDNGCHGGNSPTMWFSDRYLDNKKQNYLPVPSDQKQIIDNIYKSSI